MDMLTNTFQVIEGITCLNPGNLSKKRGAGHYAALNVQARTLSEEEREAGQAVAHNVFERTRVAITRI